MYTSPPFLPLASPSDELRTGEPNDHNANGSMESSPVWILRLERESADRMPPLFLPEDCRFGDHQLPGCLFCEYGRRAARLDTSSNRVVRSAEQSEYLPVHLPRRASQPRPTGRASVDSRAGNHERQCGHTYPGDHRQQSVNACPGGHADRRPREDECFRSPSENDSLSTLFQSAQARARHRGDG